MLRQHRAWQAEAIAGDRHAAQETLTQHYPEKLSGSGFDALVASLDMGTDRRAPTHPDVLTAERRCLAAVASDIGTAWYGAPQGKAAFSKWCQRLLDDDDPDSLDNYGWATQAITKAAGECCKDYPDPARPPAHDHGHVLMKVAGLSYIADEALGYDSEFWANMAQWHRERSTAISVDITARIEAIDQALAAIEHLTGLTKQSHSISDELELIGKYETRNNRQLKQAIEQLQQLQAARQPSDGITLKGIKAPS